MSTRMDEVATLYRQCDESSFRRWLLEDYIRLRELEAETWDRVNTTLRNYDRLMRAMWEKEIAKPKGEA